MPIWAAVLQEATGPLTPILQEVAVEVFGESFGGRLKVTFLDVIGEKNAAGLVIYDLNRALKLCKASGIRPERDDLGHFGSSAILALRREAPDRPLTLRLIRHYCDGDLLL